MIDPVVRLARAEAAAEIARTRLIQTTERLQERLEPRKLVREARLHLAGARASAVERAGDAVRRKPGVLIGVVAVAGLWLGRKRIASLVRRGEDQATGDPGAS